MKELLVHHKEEYGREPDIVVSAPGVINLMGEHTDYNGGFVLIAGLNRELHIAVSRRNDNSLRFFAADYGERKRTSIPNLKFKREDRWANNPKGVLWSIMQRGHILKGMDISISSTIPERIGLGSSAALSIATVWAVKGLFGLGFSKQEAVDIVETSESSFNNIQKTVTDLYGSLFAKKNYAMFFDAREKKYDFIPINLKEYSVLITLANVPHVSIGQELEQKEMMCQECVSKLNTRKAGTSLRDYTPDDLQFLLGKVEENKRRVCMHVVEENQRVFEARRAFIKKDMMTYGRLLNRSHESLRDNYEISCPEVDWLVKRALELDDVLGARLFGKGFAGGTISLLKNKALDPYYERLSEYEHIFGFQPGTFLFEASAGAKIVHKSRRRIRA